MKIIENLIISEAKITRYLLVPKVRNDKSKFLAQIITIWLQRQIDGKFQFVTLKPRKES